MIASQSARARRWWGGGTTGNEILTNLSGAALILLLAVIGLTILRIRQLITVHLFVGVLLLGPLALKLASTGYRFVRYYAGTRAYREKGPPELPLRLLAPGVLVSTLVVFATGMLLLFGGPSTRRDYLTWHKVSFIVWLLLTAIHVVAHLPSVLRTLAIAGRHARSEGMAPGAAGRWLSLAGAVVAGLVLALVLLRYYGAWTGPGALGHHHLHG